MKLKTGSNHVEIFQKLNNCIIIIVHKLVLHWSKAYTLRKRVLPSFQTRTVLGG